MTELDATDLKDLAQGACLLASGGGGPRTMIAPLLDLLSKQPSPRLADIKEVGDDELAVVLAGAGMPSTVTADSVASLSQAVTSAFESAEKQLGKISYIIPVETGVANTLLPLVTAAAKSIPLIDGAGARRSLPSLTMTKFAAVPISPMIVATSAKSAMTINIGNTTDAEKVMMAIVSSQKAAIGLVMWPMRGAVAKQNVSPQAVTYTLDLGRALRTSKASGTPAPVHAVTQHLGGGVLFTAPLKDVQHKTAGGFDLDIAVFDDGSGRTLCVYSQNESLLAWSNTNVVPAAMAPDLICYLTTGGDVYTNADIETLKGQKTQVAVLGAPAPSDLEDPKLLDAFLDALRPIGYAGPRVPLALLRSISSPDPKRLVVTPPKPTAPPSSGWRQQFRE